MSRFVDLTHTLKSGITVYPGTQPPVIEEVCSIATDGFSERLIKMYSHTGTHLDVPAHIFAKGKTITDLDADIFCGPALKFMISRLTDISIEIFEKRLLSHGMPEFIIFETGWDRRWGTTEYFNDFPLPSNAIFEYLSKLGLKGIGIDAISIDLLNSSDFPNHQSILSQEMIIIENLTNLNLLPDSLFDLFCFPLKIEHGDGSPVRAVARISE